MRWNEAEVAVLAHQPPEWEGKLTYRAPKTKNSRGFPNLAFTSSTSQNETRDRWFRLRANCLFYLRLGPSDSRPAPGTEPMGVFILEGFHVQSEGFEAPNAFSILFADEPNAEKRHLFVAESERSAAQWTAALRLASYQGLRERLVNLQIKLREKTGQDPLRGTGFQHNQLFDIQAACKTEFAPAAALDVASPPKPKPRKPKPKTTFQSHVMENWEEHSPVSAIANSSEENEDVVLVQKKPSFRSHVPVGNLLDI